MHFRATGLVASVVSTESCIVCPAVTCELRNCVIIIDAKAPGFPASELMPKVLRSCFDWQIAGPKTSNRKVLDPTAADR